MDRYLKIIIFIMAVITFIAFDSSVLQANDSKNEKQITTQEQAAKHAAKLANEKCQKDFGYSPFKPETYKAELVDSKWRWGKIEPIGVQGYSAKVEFSIDGSDENVQVAFSTDKIINKPALQKVPMEIEVVRPKELEKEGLKIDGLEEE